MVIRVVITSGFFTDLWRSVAGNTKEHYLDNSSGRVPVGINKNLQKHQAILCNSPPKAMPISFNILKGGTPPAKIKT